MPAKIDLPATITCLSDEQLREELRSHNFDAGPILFSTRSVYERKLYALQTGLKVRAYSDYSSASDDESDDAPPQSPQRPYSKQRSPLKKKPGERRDGGAEILVRKPSPRKPLHPGMGDYPRHGASVGASRRAPSASKSKSAPPAAAGGRAGLPVPLWTIALVVVAAAVIIYLVIRNMESDPVSNIPNEIEMNV